MYIAPHGLALTLTALALPFLVDSLGSQLMTGLDACQLIEEKSTTAQGEKWRLMWMPAALQLLDSPLLRVRLQSVLALAEPCRWYGPNNTGFTVDDKSRLVGAAFNYLSPYDTPAKRVAAALIFGCASSSQLPAALPLLVGFLQREDEPNCLVASCVALGLIAKLHHPPLSHYGVATRTVAMMRQADPRVSSAACLLAVIILTQEPGSEERQSFMEQMIQAGLLTLQVLRPLLTRANAECRDEAALVLEKLHTAVATSPLMADDAFLRLLLESMCDTNYSSSSNVNLSSLLSRLIDFATPVQRPLFLSAGVIPQLLGRIDFRHAPTFNGKKTTAQKTNWNILLALRRMLAWPECSVQPNQLHPFCLQLLQSSTLPQLEGQSSSAALNSAAR